MPKSLVRCAKTLLHCDRGAVAVEYGIIVTAMFAAIIPGFLYVASGIQVKFSDIGGYFGN